MLLKWAADFIVEYLSNQAHSCVRNVRLWYELLGVPHQEACVHLCLCKVEKDPGLIP